MKKNRKRVKELFTVLNEKGLHTRPSTELVRCACKFRSEVHLSYRNYVVNAKSILGILMLAAERGAKVQVEAMGEDSQEAVDAIVALSKKRFNHEF